MAWIRRSLICKMEKSRARISPAVARPLLTFLARNGNRPIGAMGSSQPDQDIEQYSTHSFGAVFAEVAVDEQLGMQRVRRVTGVYDVGTLLNEKTGKSQLIGGIVWGIGLALFEETHLDGRMGRAVNNNLAEYHVPVNADIGEIDVSALNIPDTKFDPLGGSRHWRDRDHGGGSGGGERNLSCHRKTNPSRSNDPGHVDGIELGCASSRVPARTAAWMLRWYGVTSIAADPFCVA